MGNNGQLVALGNGTKLQVSQGMEQKSWKQRPKRACTGAISSWGAGINVTRDRGLFCGLKADAAAGRAPDFLLGAPAQSGLLPTEQASVYVAYRKP